VLIIRPRKIEELEFSNGVVKVNWRHIYNNVGLFEGRLPRRTMHFLRKLTKFYTVKEELLLIKCK